MNPNAAGLAFSRRQRFCRNYCTFTYRKRKFDTLAAAMALLSDFDVEVWPLAEDDVRDARQLHEKHSTLQARDLCHLASCQRRGVIRMETFDRALAAAANRNFGNRQ